MKKSPPACFVGPKGKTSYGTTLEVLADKGCGLLLARKVGDKEASPYIVHSLDLTGVTPKDEAILAAFRIGAGKLEAP